ncbi:hypothetical protein BGZ83_002506 [Gryganskiella cystojenkinii]|nr:hypothetical protein BGZ83_002506 [Gryganskiella cystojenkinii]
MFIKANKLPIERMEVLLTRADRKKEDELELTLTYVIGDETQKIKVFMKELTMRSNLAYRTALNLFLGRAHPGDRYLVSDVAVNKAYTMRKVHHHVESYCGFFVLKNCRFGFPKAVADETKMDEETGKDRKLTLKKAHRLRLLHEDSTDIMCPDLWMNYVCRPDGEMFEEMTYPEFYRGFYEMFKGDRIEPYVYDELLPAFQVYVDQSEDERRYKKNREVDIMRRLCQDLRDEGEYEPVILASSGVAACNIGDWMIHRFFRAGVSNHFVVNLFTIKWCLHGITSRT